MSTSTAPTQSPPPSIPVRVRFDRFELDEANATLICDGKAVALPPTPFAVLCALVRQPASLLTKHALLDQVWGHQVVSDSVLKTAISDLRAVLHDDARHPRLIETVSRRGYRFIAATTAIRASSPPGTAGAPNRSLPLPPFIGRAEALSRLRSAWDTACSGRGAVVWVAGEPGIGKTLLIEHFVAGLGDFACARGQCVEHYGTGEPYLPVLEALAELCRSDSEVPTLLRTVAPTWLLQLPWLSTAEERAGLQRELAGVGPDRMLREMAELLDRYTANRPVLLITEDLHWSDRATLQLMDYIARRRGRSRLLWLASFRLTEIIGGDHPFRAVRHELRLHGLAEEIVLDAFSEREVAEYLAARIPALAAEEAFVRALHGRTHGLPLFVADVVSDLIAHGEPGIEGESSALVRLDSMVVPESLTGIIERYIQQLTPGERAPLEAASVCGVEFRSGTVARMLERDVASVAESFAELTRQQRWLIEVPLAPCAGVPDAGYVFRHALYREVLYRRIGPLARVELHRNVAAALERERADGRNVSAAELASHFELGRDPMPALRYYAEAAESALMHVSPSQTMSLTERALALLAPTETSDARATLEITLAALRGIAAVQLLGAGSIEAKRAFERAYSLLDRVPQHPSRGSLLHGYGLVLCLRGELDQADALAERTEVLSLATGDPTVLACASLIHGLAQHFRGRPRRAREWLEKGVAVLEGLDQTPAAVVAADLGVLLLCFLAIELLHLGFVDQGRARMRAAHARARAVGAPGPRSAVLWLDALFGVLIGEPERVRDVGEQLRALVDEYALEARAPHLWFRGWAEAHVGDPRAGYRLIREGCEQALRLGIRAWGSETHGYAAEALARAGDWSAARKELEAAWQCTSAIGERQYLTPLLLLDARISDALDEPARAREATLQAVAEARAQESLWFQVSALSALCAREDKTAKDVASLRLVLDQLTEGLDTALVERARALLKKTRSKSR
jgi:DNA-binding winged helix-turn-helix (wHTH) protein/tetratricopeptide (TPR) repeat protein